MPIASNAERASCESTRGRAPATVEYGNRLVRIERPRAQGHRPLPDTGTRTRAFNASAALSPNLSVPGSVIGSKHPSNRSFCSLAHQRSQSVVGCSKVVGTSRQDPLETSKVSALPSEALSGIRPSSRHVPSQRRVGQQRTAPQPL